MKIAIANHSDYGYIQEHDHHILQGLILQKIKGNEIYILRDEHENSIGWMRYGYFWDNTPFMNMIWVEELYRGQGLGKQVVLFWEEEMRHKGFKLVMTSTLANEEAQHFYRKLGYRDSGCLLLENEPLEIILTKNLFSLPFASWLCFSDRGSKENRIQKMRSCIEAVTISLFRGEKHEEVN